MPALAVLYGLSYFDGDDQPVSRIRRWVFPILFLSIFCVLPSTSLTVPDDLLSAQLWRWLAFAYLIAVSIDTGANANRLHANAAPASHSPPFWLRALFGIAHFYVENPPRRRWLYAFGFLSVSLLVPVLMQGLWLEGLYYLLVAHDGGQSVFGLLRLLVHFPDTVSYLAGQISHVFWEVPEQYVYLEILALTLLVVGAPLYALSWLDALRTARHTGAKD